MTTLIATLARALVLALLLAAGAVEPPAGQQVSGQVSGLRGNDHVVIKATGPTTLRATTRAAGIWSLPKVRPGTYTVTPYHARYSFQPSRRVITLSDEPVRDVDFTAVLVEPP